MPPDTLWETSDNAVQTGLGFNTVPTSVMAEQHRVDVGADFERCDLSAHHVTELGQLYVHAIGCIRWHRVSHAVSRLQGA